MSDKITIELSRQELDTIFVIVGFAMGFGERQRDYTLIRWATIALNILSKYDPDHRDFTYTPPEPKEKELKAPITPPNPRLRVAE